MPMTQDEQDKITWLTRGFEVLEAGVRSEGAAEELLKRVLGAGTLAWKGGKLILTDHRPGSNLELATPDFLEALGPLAERARKLL